MKKDETSEQAFRDRSIRVFVSSTFRDMQAEREELLKRIFPQLRKLCESRGVTWGEVDLRWGITDEQSAEGKVLPICLAEIQNCRPYFIGILGERYGWVPQEIAPDLLAREPWLAEHSERSVTELEIVHGVLNDPEMADHTFFYLRSPSYIESLPTDERGAYLERPTPQELQAYGADEAERRSKARRDKLDALKRRLRESGLPVREDYTDPQALGALVLKDLTAVVDRLYPEGSELEPLDAEAVEHEALAASRARVYVRRTEYYERLDAHARGDGPPLVVLGESGCGKSALLANWALRYRAARPGELLIAHFVGASTRSTDWAAMARRIIGELNRRLGLQIGEPRRGIEGEPELPTKPDELREAFADALNRASARGRVILILDGLNQLEDRDGALDLAWVPPEIPDAVRLIVSTLPGKPLDDIRRRGWPALEVQPLRLEERMELIERYLAQYSKQLTREQTERIAGAAQTANPLYLRALLEELRLWGEHETLDARIAHYLAAVQIDDLYATILARYEKDYEDRPRLVRDAMSLIWAARRGISESELLDLLGSNGEPLPHAHWSPLFLAAEASLVNRSGLIGFSHQFIRKAVADRYLATESARRAAHVRLAGYFLGREMGPRQLDEAPWQLAEAADWDSLADFLTLPSVLLATWNRPGGDYEVMEYWTRLEENSRWRVADGYRRVIEEPEKWPICAVLVGRLLERGGDVAKAMELKQLLLELFQQAGDPSLVAAELDDLGQSCLLAGELERALEYRRRAEEAWKEAGNERMLAFCRKGQAEVLLHSGDLRAADRMFRTAERMFTELGEQEGLADTRRGRARILQARGDRRGALSLMDEVERYYRAAGDQGGVAEMLVDRAGLHHELGEYRAAHELYAEAEEVGRRLGAKMRISTAVHGRALALAGIGDLDAARELLAQDEEICRESGDPRGLALALYNHALILAESSATRQLARAKCDEAMELFTSLGMDSETAGVRALKIRIGAGVSSNRVILVAVLLCLGGIAIGFLNPWLWLLGLPVSFIVLAGLAVGRVPWIRDPFRRYASQYLAEWRWEEHEQQSVLEGQEQAAEPAPASRPPPRPGPDAESVRRPPAPRPERRQPSPPKPPPAVPARPAKRAPPPKTRAKPRASDPCPCGSGKKYNKCCGRP
jgi:tetratricopeptide (TPR) repeat protein